MTGIGEVDDMDGFVTDLEAFPRALMSHTLPNHATKPDGDMSCT
jgi:hypothetical protein